MVLNNKARPPGAGGRGRQPASGQARERDSAAEVYFARGVDVTACPGCGGPFRPPVAMLRAYRARKRKVTIALPICWDCHLATGARAEAIASRFAEVAELHIELGCEKAAKELRAAIASMRDAR